MSFVSSLGNPSVSFAAFVSMIALQGCCFDFFSSISHLDCSQMRKFFLQNWNPISGVPSSQLSCKIWGAHLKCGTRHCWAVERHASWTIKATDHRTCPFSGKGTSNWSYFCGKMIGAKVTQKNAPLILNMIETLLESALKMKK